MLVMMKDYLTGANWAPLMAYLKAHQMVYLKVYLMEQKKVDLLVEKREFLKDYR